MKNANSEKKRSLLKTSFLTSGFMYLYTLVFSALSALFLFVSGLHFMIYIGVGAVFGAPVVILAAHHGIKIADEEFSARNHKLSGEKITTFERVPLYYPIVAMLPYLALPLVCVLIGELSGIIAFQTVALVIAAPAALIFRGASLINLASVSWWAALAVGIYCLACLISVTAGFINKEKERERAYIDIVNEIQLSKRY